MLIPAAADKQRATPATAIQSDYETDDPNDVPFRVFLLEDNEGNAMVFEGFLETVCAPDMVVASTLAELDEHRSDILEGVFDLVVFDIMLPDGESTDAMKELSGSAPTPFCAYTARISPIEHERFRAAGAKHIFAKPLQYLDFAEHIEPFVSQAHKS